MKRAVSLALLALSASCASVRPEEEVIQEAKDKVFPAVVFIKPIQQEFRGGKMEKIQVFGSGAIIDSEGHVVTNNHVAEKATEIKCVLSDREEISAKIVGLDPEICCGCHGTRVMVRIGVHDRLRPPARAGRVEEGLGL